MTISIGQRVRLSPDGTYTAEAPPPTTDPAPYDAVQMVLECGGPLSTFVFEVRGRTVPRPVVLLMADGEVFSLTPEQANILAGFLTRAAALPAPAPEEG